MNPPPPSKNSFEQGLRTYLSEEQLKRIQSKKIGIAGVGGLGSNVAMILVRSGFRHFELLDFDIIEPSNLNRQQYFYDELGQKKLDVTVKRLKDINPQISIQAHDVHWQPNMADAYFQNVDFLVEAFDQADIKFDFVQYALTQNKPLISGNGMAGLTEKKPMRVRRMQQAYFVGDGTTDTACGHPPMAPRVTACAAMMAEVILDLTLNIKV